MARVGDFYRRRCHNEAWKVKATTHRHVMLECLGTGQIVGLSAAEYVTVPLDAFKKTWVRVRASVNVEVQAIDHDVDKLMSQLYK